MRRLGSRTAEGPGEQAKQTWGHDCLREAGAGRGGDAVAVDVVLLTLYGQRVGQAEEPQLSRAVVRLPKVPIDAGSRRGHDDPAKRRSAGQPPHLGKNKSRRCTIDSPQILTIQGHTMNALWSQTDEQARPQRSLRAAV